ncbi:Acetylornithine deacetylase [Bosea sp. 62]|uniref:M20 family metallopeptidase n=1 Tax=unclassified Bosea (in: a-proteobacteria) TaxID=2653178 RepID=UPI001251B697|nr:MULTISPECIES: M20/M25/M40 family metallo-hydrolase [unclassified Bosea (in: a-proteobacteria)]CAD5257055.1 Acetylornithine deacetylase [Bosea sp. 46]CAD5261500.1 Acetylornithine deacetylase [Bosea sp. 21B]CAD5279086.1 Acetylornithine deacetylase [Bosea sp. 7B]VVT58489.1 Acetylornithine deacetylase [Bosea sp. EC-HK365B]VXB54919.1 Acetylornithine deacetylase [Bosea sp. 29B]
MNPRDLIHVLDEKACLALLSDWVKHKSYSETEGEKALVHHVVGQMQAMGIEAEAQPFDDGRRANAIGRWKGTGGGKSLLFNGHLDTNPATEGWTVDPWGGVVDDEFIYGIGVSNMKAGDAASYCAVKTLRDAGVKLKGDVILTYVVGELQGGVGTVAAIRNGIRADYFVNSEPTDVQAVTMHACAFSFVIELTGNTRHLSKREQAVDAIMAACDLIPRLNAMTFSGAPSPEHESINRVHVGVVHGALGKELHEWRAPQVSDYCKLKGSGRYAPGQTEAGALADMQRELAALEQRFPGLKASIRIEKKEGHQSMPAFEVAKDARIVKTVNAAYQVVRSETQPTGAIKPPGFFGTDAGHLYAEAGMEGIVCGPGGRYNTMPDERVEIRDFLDMVRIYMLTILDICEVA